eukprot:GHVQ01025668.1.p1 GENE.GHVQ01025668.1~~GHVQ01025668.1.p1  ORF type:complete len:265 (+),score=67.44 GHVQ01025668.1:153-947(+)
MLFPHSLPPSLDNLSSSTSSSPLLLPEPLRHLLSSTPSPPFHITSNPSQQLQQPQTHSHSSPVFPFADLQNPSVPSLSENGEEPLSLKLMRAIVRNTDPQNAKTHVRITVSDGRIISGSLECVDCCGNCVLYGCEEFVFFQDQVEEGTTAQAKKVGTHEKKEVEEEERIEGGVVTVGSRERVSQGGTERNVGLRGGYRTANLSESGTSWRWVRGGEVESKTGSVNVMSRVRRLPVLSIQGKQIMKVELRRDTLIQCYMSISNKC